MAMINEAGRIAPAVMTLCIASATAAFAANPENVAYVSTADAIVVIDLARLEATRKIDVGGKGPRGLAVTPDGRHLLSANQGSADVSVIDTTTFTVTRRIRVGKNPEFMRLEHDGKIAYVTYEPSVESGPPKQGAKEEKGGSPAEVAAVDPQKGTATSFLMGGRETEGIEFSPDGKYIVVTNEGDDTLAVYDKTSGKAVKTVDVKAHGTRPRGIKVSPDGRVYVVSMEHSNSFAVFDSELKFMKSVPTGTAPYGIAFDRAGKRIVVAAARAKTLQVFDAQTFAPIRSIPVGERCWHFTFTPDDTKILVACGRSNDVHVVDATTYAPLKVIPIDKTPWGIVTYPKAFGSLDAP